jgi:hypothetical protein
MMSTKPIQDPIESDVSELITLRNVPYPYGNNTMPDLKNTSRPELPAGPANIDLETLISSCNETVRAAVSEHLSSGRTVYGLDQFGELVETRR